MINAESMNTRLRHLRSRIERLQTLKSISRETFFADMDARDAVERNFQVAVECCLDIALVHHYMTVDPEKMYTYLQNDIPNLERFELVAAAFIEHETTSGNTPANNE